jgi:hypothetical protein
MCLDNLNLNVLLITQTLIIALAGHGGTRL